MTAEKRAHTQILNPRPGPLVGKTFSQVFVHEPLKGEFHRWRLRGSGINEMPEFALVTGEVLEVCRELGFEVEVQNWGAPGATDTYERRCAFLDGGVYCQTGNYLRDPKGAWVSGAKAVYFLACALGIKVREPWKKRFRVGRLSVAALLEELQVVFAPWDVRSRPGRTSDV